MEISSAPALFDPEETPARVEVPKLDSSSAMEARRVQLIAQTPLSAAAASVWAIQPGGISALASAEGAWSTDPGPEVDEDTTAPSPIIPTSGTAPIATAAITMPAPVLMPHPE